MKQERDFDENDYYYIYILGYDLLHDLLIKCESNECDRTFETCKGIYKWFLDTEYAKMYHLSLYDSLQMFVNEKMFSIKQVLFNELGYDIMADYEYMNRK